MNAIGKKSPPAIAAVVEKAYEFGCEKAKIIDTRTVIIEKWVRWKCLYGFSLQEISDLLSLRVESDKTCGDVKQSVKAKLIDNVGRS